MCVYVLGIDDLITEDCFSYYWSFKINYGYDFIDLRSLPDSLTEKLC